MNQMMSNVYVSPKVWSVMKYCVDTYPLEISFLADMTVDDGIMYVNRLHIPEQENGPASTDMCPESTGQIPIPKKGYTNCWIHSHVNMETNFSGTDYDTMKQIGKNGYVLSIVVNKKGKYKCSYYQKGDGFYPEIYIEDIPITIGTPLSDETKSELDKIMELNCTQKTYVREIPTEFDIDVDKFRLGEIQKSDVFKPLTKKEMKMIRREVLTLYTNKELQEGFEDCLHMFSNNSDFDRDEIIDTFINLLKIDETDKGIIQ